VPVPAAMVVGMASCRPRRVAPFPTYTKHRRAPATPTHRRAPATPRHTGTILHALIPVQMCALTFRRMARISASGVVPNMTEAYAGTTVRLTAEMEEVAATGHAMDMAQHPALALARTDDRAHRRRNVTRTSERDFEQVAAGHFFNRMAKAVGLIKQVALPPAVSHQLSPGTPFSRRPLRTFAARWSRLTARACRCFHPATRSERRLPPPRPPSRR
jgi:hypothetical protein